MPELLVLCAAGGTWVVYMQCLVKAVRWLAVLACVGLQWASAAPISTPSQLDSPAETPTAEEPIRSDVGPARRLRSETQRPGERTVSSEVSTGQKNLDLLLELEGRSAKGNEAAGGSTNDEARQEAAKAARKRLMEFGAPIPEKSAGTGNAGTNKVSFVAPVAGGDRDMNEPEGEPTSEGRRWTGGLGGTGREQDNGAGGDAAARRDDGFGANFSNTKTRKLLLLLQEYRDWVVAGTVVASLLVLASGAASRARRRR